MKRFRESVGNLLALMVVLALVGWALAYILEPYFAVGWWRCTLAAWVAHWIVAPHSLKSEAP